MRTNNLIPKTALGDWLWNYRKLLCLEGLLLLSLELVCLFPEKFIWWVGLMLLEVIVFGWWIGNLVVNRASILLISEMLWVLLAGLGFMSFSLLNSWQVQLVVMIIVTLTVVVGYWHQRYIDHDRWDLSAINWLGLIDLLVLFVTTAVIMLAAHFYGLGIFWLMIGMAIQFGLALYLYFWRHHLTTKKFWLYAVVLALAAEQLVWVISVWHQNIYFKAFLLLVMYYLFSEFVSSYSKGNLTIRVVVEYLGIALILVLALLLFNVLFLVAPNI